MKRNRCNSSGIGTASHPEEHHELFIKFNSTQKSRNKCINYEYETKFCKKLKINCVGTSNELCKHYSEAKSAIDDESRDDNRVNLFKGIKLINTSDINTKNKKFARPSQYKLDNLIEYYKKHNMMDVPVVISYNNGKFLLKDKYLRYYVANILDIEKIHAIIDIPENEIFFKLMTLGQNVKHKHYGIGTVKNVTMNIIEIEFFQTGKKGKFDINTCVEAGLISLL